MPKTFCFFPWTMRWYLPGMYFQFSSGIILMFSSAEEVTSVLDFNATDVWALLGSIHFFSYLGLDFQNSIYFSPEGTQRGGCDWDAEQTQIYSGVSRTLVGVVGVSYSIASGVNTTVAVCLEGWPRWVFFRLPAVDNEFWFHKKYKRCTFSAKLKTLPL